MFGRPGLFFGLGLPIGDQLGFLGTSNHYSLGHFGFHGQFVHQRIGTDLFDVEHVDHAHRDHLVDFRRIDALDIPQGLFQYVQAGVEFHRRENIDVPPCQAGGQADVLPALADC